MTDFGIIHTIKKKNIHHLMMISLFDIGPTLYIIGSNTCLTYDIFIFLICIKIVNI